MPGASVKKLGSGACVHATAIRSRAVAAAGRTDKLQAESAVKQAEQTDRANGGGVGQQRQVEAVAQVGHIAERQSVLSVRLQTGRQSIGNQSNAVLTQPRTLAWNSAWMRSMPRLGRDTVKGSSCTAAPASLPAGHEGQAEVRTVRLNRANGECLPTVALLNDERRRKLLDRRGRRQPVPARTHIA